MVRGGALPSAAALLLLVLVSLFWVGRVLGTG
jgi:hypothetical protein